MPPEVDDFSQDHTLPPPPAPEMMPMEESVADGCDVEKIHNGTEDSSSSSPEPAVPRSIHRMMQSELERVISRRLSSDSSNVLVNGGNGGADLDGTWTLCVLIDDKERRFVFCYRKMGGGNSLRKTWLGENHGFMVT